MPENHGAGEGRVSCAYCGTPLADTARFCGACGRPTASPSAPKSAAVAFDETLAANSDVKALGHQSPAGQVGQADPVPARRRADSEAETLFGERSPLLDSGAGPAAVPGSVPPDDPHVGTVLKGRFEIKTKLGEGGFGAVYGGVQSGTGRRVAIKMLHPEMTRDSNVVARFRREGQVLCNLRDAHTITTYDFDQTEDGTLFIAMELLEGRSLHDVFHSEAPIEWSRMIKFLSECCSSLAEAHAQGIIHRDLKPENIHLEKRSGNPEFVKILDFGIAKVVHGDGLGKSDQPQLTATGQTLGTLEYMSPEQLMGKQLDGRSDIYGLGVVAYELLTGQLPFPDATGPAALIAAQLRKTPRPPSSVNQRVPKSVDALILKMLEKDRENRHADSDDLRRACNELLNTERSGSAAAFSPSGPTPAVAAAPVQQNTPPPGQRPPPGMQPGPMAGPGVPQHQAAASFPHKPIKRQMGPDTRAEVAASRGNNRIVIIVALAILAALVAVGVVLAVTS